MADLTQYVRHGEGFSLSISGADADATIATLKVGTTGSTSASLTKSGDLTDGSGTISVSDSENTLAVGTYSYQIDITSGDTTDIFPDPTKSDQDLPDFIVAESFD